MLVSVALGAEIKNVTNNQGILPILLGPAKLITSQHTLIHHYKIDLLIDEFHKLTSQYEKILEKTKLNNYQINETDEYCSLIEYSIDLIKEKIAHININERRQKRGLVNGLGSVIKLITGNLDAYDGERYETLFSRIKNNELSIQDQLDSQFTIVSTLTENFNSTIQDIRFNNDQIKNKLTEVDNFIKTSSNKSVADSIKEVLNHQQLLLNLLLTIFQDIENSITFCKLGTLHPSIIGTHQLYEELLKISDVYGSKLPLEVKYENILEIESKIQVTCAIHDKEIVYFLNIPLSDNHEYHLYHLRSIPTYKNDQYVSIFPNVNYLMKSKSNSSVVTLSGNCQKGTIITCPKTLISNQDAKCEKEIIASGTTEKCKYVTVKFEDNWIESIPESNQHLAIFPFGDKIEVTNKHNFETLELKGIYLISELDSEVYYKDQPLHSESETVGQPKPTFKLKNHKCPMFH